MCTHAHTHTSFLHTNCYKAKKLTITFEPQKLRGNGPKWHQGERKLRSFLSTVCQWLDKETKKFICQKRRKTFQFLPKLEQEQLQKTTLTGPQGEGCLTRTEQASLLPGDPAPVSTSRQTKKEQVHELITSTDPTCSYWTVNCPPSDHQLCWQDHVTGVFLERNKLSLNGMSVL